MVPAMTDDELMEEARPWLEELLRRRLLAVQVHMPETAITPAAVALAWPDESNLLDLESQFALDVADWFDEEPVPDLRQEFAANWPPRPRPVS
jgi:hypothetical protein